ncbi:two-partner secretion domain-containing protein [Methylophilus medardicus]|uniref:Filamentous hemagglutinin N-terminal domain-containing protein n=1 Tax=Methylophilus medardicus TaxID=2588534 RepID=A0A5B8CV67_9PROT|nr:filamentous hemagglutinin N-terminal domain-containing protein [Methylophilus medardicus]QDC45197.1 filamentous hemagglutinin N-terminal domain-containing protein [Methylophilus medardicus]QDC50204.1 filamentous hemagglutinin N-terminal domain-containing protein [Methylophilus medardicus]QDC53909.1 filamentous hemagglutinin N-terminal domain-containing protein [Methylophilus medardicus]
MKAASLNHVYRLVWNKLQQAWVAVAETTRAHGKSHVNGQVSAAATTKTALGVALTAATQRQLVVASAFAAAIMPLSSFADNNVVAGVIAGDLTVKEVSATHTQYVHTANVNIVDFYKFGVMKGNQLDVIMPDAGRALYRVIGDSRSEIMGTLNANGSLFLVNQNGVLFGQGAEVNVGNIVASSLNITNEAFLQGNYQFNAGNLIGNVENRGVIKTQGEGYIVLLGKTVDNSGTLVANNGSVVLGSAQTATLDFFGNGLVKAKLSGDALEANIKNSGNIYADGGFVQMATNARAAAINISGIVEANQLVERNGMIRLEGGDHAKVEVSGQLIAQGQGTTGGSIEVTGEQVALMDGAVLDASGDTGGGKVLVGGDYQGKNDAVYNARTTYVSSGATIKADALKQGDGGKVIVWADDLTRYYGQISAQGGALSGNGGFVEVSGKQNLAFIGKVNVAALNGVGGSVLLDPENIVLDNSAQPSPSNNPNGTADVAFADNAGNLTTIQIDDVKGFSELFLQASNNITVASALTMNNGGSIRLVANNDINVNAAINTVANTTTLGSGSITLTADADGNNVGNLAIGADITAKGGAVNLSAATLTHTAGDIITTGADAFTANGNRNAGSVKITVAGLADLGNANITATGGVPSSNANGFNGGSVIIQAGSLNMTGTIDTSGGRSGAPGNGATTPTMIDGISQPIGRGGAGGNVNIATTGDASVGNINTGAGAAGRNSIVSVASGEVNVKSSAGNVSVGNVSTQGGFNAIGSKVTLAANGAVTSGTINSSAGATRSNTDGKSAGAVNITAGTSITTQAITASGADGNGTNKAGGNAGAVTLQSTTGDVSFGPITVVSGAKTGSGIAGNGADVLVKAGQDVNMNGNVTSNSNAATAVQLVAGRNFINGADSSITTGATGRWTVYSNDPTGDVKGSNLLASYDYKQYGTAFGGALLGTGNGFVHKVSPTVTATLSGTSSKVFDGNNTVTDLSGLTLTTSGVLDNDVVTFSPSTLNSAAFDNAAVGTGKAITTVPTTITSAVTNEGKMIYNAYTTVSNDSTATGSIIALPVTPTVAGFATPRDDAGLGGLIPNNPLLNTMFIVSLNPAAGDEEDLDAVACPTPEDHLGSTPILSSGVKLPDGVNSNCI